MLCCCKTETPSPPSTISHHYQHHHHSRPKMKYNRFINRAEHGTGRKHANKKTKHASSDDAAAAGSREEEECLMHKCYLVFCLWRRSAVMADLQIDDAHDPALERELQDQWRALDPDELEAYRRVALLLSSSSSPASSSASSTSSTSCAASRSSIAAMHDENRHHRDSDDRRPSVDGEACF